MTDTSTVEEQPADDFEDVGDISDIASDIQASIGEIDERDEPVQDVDEAEPVEASDNPDDAEEAVEAEESKMSPPEHWSAADKKTFSTQSPEAQKFLLDRHKAMEGDYTRKAQEVAEIRNELGPYWEKFAQQRGKLRQHGVSVSQYMENLTNADIMLSRDPVQGIQAIAKQYGVDLGQMQGQQQEYVDPEIAALRNELNSVRQAMTQREYAEAQAKHNTMLGSVQNFAQEAGEDGSPLRPYFEDVIEDMITLAHAERQAGREPELNALYDKAIWANPDIRGKIQAAERKAADSAANKEAKSKAKKAQQASASVRGGSGVAPKADLSLREELERQFSG